MQTFSGSASDRSRTRWHTRWHTRWAILASDFRRKITRDNWTIAPQNFFISYRCVKYLFYSTHIFISSNFILGPNKTWSLTCASRSIRKKKFRPQKPWSCEINIERMRYDQTAEIKMASGSPERSLLWWRKLQCAGKKWLDIAIKFINTGKACIWGSFGTRS